MAFEYDDALVLTCGRPAHSKVRRRPLEVPRLCEAVVYNNETAAKNAIPGTLLIGSHMAVEVVIQGTCRAAGLQLSCRISVTMVVMSSGW
jgi:hypothetical protein